MRAQTNSPSSDKATVVRAGAAPGEVRASFALWLATGHSVGEFLAGAGLMGLLFASSRVVHQIAVFAPLALMFRPAANDYIRASRTAGRHSRHLASQRSRCQKTGGFRRACVKNARRRTDPQYRV